MRWRPTVLFFILWAAATSWNAGAFNLDKAREKRWQPDLVALPRPEVLKVLSVGFDAFVADMYWVGAVHYLGEPKNAAVSYGELGNYLNLVVELAPDFYSAYRFGGMAVPFNNGDRWENIDQAVTILEKGIVRFPNDWFLRLMLAYDYSAFQGRYAEAAKTLNEASRIQGSPSYLPRLASKMYVAAGDLNSAEELAQHILQNTNDQQARKAMEQRLDDVRLLRKLHIVEGWVQQFQARNGRYPASLDELMDNPEAQKIKAQVEKEFQYDPATGKVTAVELQHRLDLNYKDNKK